MLVFKPKEVVGKVYDLDIILRSNNPTEDSKKFDAIVEGFKVFWSKYKYGT